MRRLVQLVLRFAQQKGPIFKEDPYRGAWFAQSQGGPMVDGVYHGVGHVGQHPANGALEKGLISFRGNPGRLNTQFCTR